MNIEAQSTQSQSGFEDWESFKLGDTFKTEVEVECSDGLKAILTGWSGEYVPPQIVSGSFSPEYGQRALQISTTTFQFYLRFGREITRFQMSYSGLIQRPSPTPPKTGFVARFHGQGGNHAYDLLESQSSDVQTLNIVLPTPCTECLIGTFTVREPYYYFFIDNLRWS